jgi:hypothetical protein
MANVVTGITGDLKTGEGSKRRETGLSASKGRREEIGNMDVSAK